MADRLDVYVTYPENPDLSRVEAHLGPLADRVRLIGGPGYHDPAEVRTQKRLGPLDDRLLALEPPLTADHLAAYLGAQVIVALDVPERLAALSPDLRWIQAAGAGVGQFGEPTLAGREVVLTTAAGVGAPPIAEFVIGRLLELYKGLRTFDRMQREHRWEFAPGEMLSGKTMLIVGLGAIGREVAIRARALGVRTVGIRRSYEPGMTSPVVDALGGPDQLDDLLPAADIVVVAAPQTAETDHLFDAGRFARMRPGAVLCNVARGSLVDEAALVDAVTSGPLRAAILDVVEHEPLDPASPLWDVDGIFLSPHSSTSTDGYDDRLLDLFAANLVRYLTGEPLENLVDLSVVGAR